MDHSQAIKENHDCIKIDSLETFEVINNYLLCKVIPYNTLSKSGLQLVYFHENQYIGENANRVFEVIKTPKFLRHKGRLSSANRPMEWMTDMELLPGDKIWVRTYSAANHLQVEANGDIYALIHYEDVMTAKRGEDVVVINGWMVCEEVYDTIKVLDYEKKKVNGKKLKVRYTGSHNKGYIRQYTQGIYTINKWDFTHDGLKDGDIVLKYDERMGAPLESDSFRTFEGDKKFILIQTRHIAGKLN